MAALKRARDFVVRTAKWLKSLPGRSPKTPPPPKP